MRAAAAMLAITMLGGTAAAESVDLLVSVPTVVAVSSTVDNRTILPEHIADGRLDTAWNSRTNQLVGAWVGFRIPADAKVETVKLTAGFTKKDKKLGDLFTMNPRIKQVRVTKDGKTLAEKTLDPELRTLQDIPLAAGPGDYKIEILDIVAGSKKAWREISISELQIWGTTTAKVKKQKPIVRVGSFDPPPVMTREECIKVMFPQARKNRIGPDADDDVITGFDALSLGNDIDICRIEHGAKGETSGTIELAAVKRSPKPTIIQRIDTFRWSKEPAPDDGGKSTSIDLTPFPLTSTETGLIVDDTDSSWGPMYDGGETTHTLYRVTPKGMTEVLQYKSTWSSGEASDADRCRLLSPKLGSSMPSLEMECIKSEGRWHGQDPRGNGLFEEPRTEKFRWKDGAYVPR